MKLKECGEKMKKFEYKVFTFNNQTFINNDITLSADLDKLGGESWELVSALPIIDGNSDGKGTSVFTDEIKFIFKREK
ncbi:DUF4177 domain-containing protein [Heyndrickxia oleronia]|jgi:hypothetical protein